MRHFSKKFFSCFLSLAIVATALPCDLSWNTVENVSAETVTTISKNPSLYDDSYIVDSNIIPDANLLLALNNIIKGSTTGLTFGELKNYSGAINLGTYTNISDIKGLGYAYGATSFDLSKLTKVREVGEYEFYECKKVTDIKLPSTVTKIGKLAFDECISLVNCDIPSAVTIIERQAFFKCEKLSKVTIPTNIEKIGNQAFANCSSITSIVIPDSIDATISTNGSEEDRGMGTEVFAYCSSLSDVTIGSGMTTIPAGLFLETTSLVTIDIPKTVVSIRDAAFKGSGLLFIDLSEDTELTQIDNYVFSYCKNLFAVKLPNTITRIGMSAFRESALDNIDFLMDCPNLVTIDANAFSHTDSLTTAIIPGSVETIGADAFRDCLYLTKIEVKDFPKGIAEKKVKVIGSQAFRNDKDRTMHDLPDLTVTLPVENEDNVNVTIEIGYNAFFGRYNLTSVNFPNNITSIGDYAFSKCGIEDVIKAEQIVRGIESFDLSDNNGIELGKGVFSYCCNLKTVSLPDTITKIPDETFRGCAYSIADQGVYRYKSADDIQEWYGGLTNVSMSSSVTYFGVSAFQDCYKLELPNGLPKTTQYIGTKAFLNCERIDNIILPIPLEYIGELAFSGTSRLFDTGEMSDLWGLQTVDASLASNLEYLGRSAFKSSAIRKFIMNEAAPVTIANDYSFNDCQFLSQISLSKNIGWVGKYSFSRCFKLKTLSISDKTTLSASLCEGVLGVSVTSQEKLKNIDKDGTLYFVIKSTSGDKFNFYTSRFMISTHPIEENLTIAENSKVDLPFYNIDIESSKSIVKDIKIGDKLYTWDAANNVFKNMETSEYLQAANDKEDTVNNTIQPTKYVTKVTNVPVWGVKLTGIKEKEKLPVVVQESLSFFIHTNCPEELVMTPSLQYNVTVTKNPCIEIKTDDDVFLSYGSTTTKDIAPEFVAESNILGDITDVVKWEVVAGAEFISLEVGKDGKTARVKSTNTDYGTATIRITAGIVVKTIHVNVCAGANSVAISNTKESLLLGKNLNLTATLKYDTALDNVCNSFPDKVKVTCSDELVAEVKDITVNGNTTSFIVESLLPGTVVITVTSLATGRVAKCTVTIGATDAKVIVTNENGQNVPDGSSVTLRNRVSNKFTYAFDDATVTSGISYLVSDTSVLDVKVDTTRKTITISGNRHGNATITVYPTIGTAEDNGVVINVNVASDISSIKLKTIRMSVNDVDTAIVQQITNVFGDSIYTFEKEKLATITDNTLSFESADPTKVTVDSTGRVEGIQTTGSQSVSIKCTSYNGDVITATATTNAFIERNSTITTTSEVVSTKDALAPEVPVGFRIEIASATSIYVYADINPNGQLNYVCVDGDYINYPSFQGARSVEITLTLGHHQIEIFGVLNGKRSAMTSPIYLEVGQLTTTTTEVTTTEKVTTVPATTEKVTTAQITTQKVTTAQPTTVKPTTTQARTTVKPTTARVTTKPVTTVKPTTKVTVERGAVSKVTRTKDNKKIKITLKRKKATKYEIAYSTSKKFTKSTTKTKLITKLSITVTKLNRKKNYYIRCRVIRIVSGKKYTGKWSLVKTSKIRR